MEFANTSNQVGDDELGIGMATYLFLKENEDDAGTQFKKIFFTVISLFNKKTWSKSSTKFCLRIRPWQI